MMFRRFLDDGVRPDLVVVEVMPHFLTCPKGTDAGAEENSLHAARLTCAELPRAASYCRQPSRFVGPWLLSRLVPSYHCQAELREFAGVDAPTTPDRPYGRDSHGLHTHARLVAGTPQQTSAFTTAWIESSRRSLEGDRFTDEARRSVRDLLTLCRTECRQTVLLAPPVRSEVLRVMPKLAELRAAELAAIAAECNVPSIDARRWLDDGDFFDAVHVQAIGVEHYSDRIGRDVLAPILKTPQHIPSHAPTVPAMTASRSKSEAGE
jgi:hypothetical protein